MTYEYAATLVDTQDDVVALAVSEFLYADSSDADVAELDPDWAYQEWAANMGMIVTATVVGRRDDDGAPLEVDISVEESDIRGLIADIIKEAKERVAE